MSHTEGTLCAASEGRMTLLRRSGDLQWPVIQKYMHYQYHHELVPDGRTHCYQEPDNDERSKGAHDIPTNVHYVPAGNKTWRGDVITQQDYETYARIQIAWVRN